jgi:hypothetical protein
VPILLKKRNLLPLNEIDVYLGQLRGRMANEQAERKSDERA